MRSDITLDILTVLKRHARFVTRAELVQSTRSNDRQVREAISDLRRQGQLIVGDEGGYRFAQTWDDVFHCISRIEHQVHVLNEVKLAMLTAAVQQFDKPTGL